MKPESIRGVVIDLCSRTFLLVGDQEELNYMSCRTPRQFIEAWNLVNEKLKPSQIEYTELAVSRK
jgi:hypothetical protein